MTAQQVATTSLVLASAGIGWLFAVTYHLLSTRAARREPAVYRPWWRDSTGRALMNLVVVIALVTTLPAIARVVGVRPDTSTWFGWLDLAVFTGVPAALVWLFGMLLRAHRVWPFRQDERP